MIYLYIIFCSWFFEACTREKAESYLATAAENKFGDTLMRESTKFKQDGSYVISKRIVRQGYVELNNVISWFITKLEI